MSVLLVQPPIVYPDEPIAGRHQNVRQKEAYIEIGLLSIASFLESKGVEVTFLNLANSETPIVDLTDLIKSRHFHLVAISCMSGYAYPSLRIYPRLIKELDPRVFVLTGGQHSGPLGKIVLDEIQEIDCVVRYEGEITTWLVYQAVIDDISKLATIPGIVARLDGALVDCKRCVPVPDINLLPFLNYRLFPHYNKYVPRLEESRGCPFDCDFCSNAAVFSRTVRYKTVERLVDELCEIREQFGKPDVFRFYLIAKNYGLDEEVTIKFAEEVMQLPFRVEWRTQSTMDVFNPDLLPLLSAAGLRIIDLGLESASPKMLRLMNKTSGDPEFYLQKAEEIIYKASQSSKTKVKLNLLFHPGETSASLAETMEFLFKWRSRIYAVTASPVMIDPGAPLWHRMDFFREHYGTRVIRNDFWDSIHIHPVDPSIDLTFEQANVVATLIGKMFQTKEAYYATRVFGGLTPGKGIAEFEKELGDVPCHMRPYANDSTRY